MQRLIIGHSDKITKAKAQAFMEEGLKVCEALVDEEGSYEMLTPGHGTAASYIAV